MSSASTSTDADEYEETPLFIKLLMLVAFLVLAYVLVVDIVGFVDILAALGPAGIR
jgi:hypothetical protein